MNKFTTAVCGAALGGTLGLGVGAAAGWFGDELAVASSTEQVQTDIDAYKAELTTYEDYNAELQKYGTVCLDLLSYYEDGGPLDGTGEDEMVDDLVLHPDKPCGNNVIDARVASRDVLAVRNKLLDLEDVDINAKYANLEDTLQEIKADEAFNAWTYAAIVGGIVGILFGISVTGVGDEERDE